MTYWLEEPRRLARAAAERAFRVTLVVSLLMHLAALVVVVQRTQLLSPDDGRDKLSDRLQVRLAAPPPPAAATAPEPSPRIVPRPKAPPPKAPARPKPPPPVLASPARAQPPAPQIPSTPEPSPAQASTPQPASAQPSTLQASPIEGDLWSYMQARRRERGEPSQGLESSKEHSLDATLAANLPRPATGTATRDANHSGGIFEIKRMTYDDAAYVFFGWNNEMGRQTPQLITVRLGDNPNMRLAVVRSMIALIRQYSKEDFLWRSPLHEQGIVLSARLADNADLESFLLHEFSADFDAPH